jgi:hypothetical protein
MLSFEEQTNVIDKSVQIGFSLSAITGLTLTNNETSAQSKLSRRGQTNFLSLNSLKIA